MNLERSARKLGALGTVSRTTFDLVTGQGTTVSVNGVPLVILQPDKTGALVDTLLSKDYEVRVPHEGLVAKGFPVPLQEGDRVDSEGSKVTLKHIRQRMYGRQLLYLCRAEGA